MSLLDGISILDLTEDYHGYATKLLADLGADVLKIERPGGDPARQVKPHTGDENSSDTSAFFGFLNTNKKSLVLDPNTNEDRDFLEQKIGQSDIIVEDHLEAYGFSPDYCTNRPLETIVVSINGFGHTGPHADFESVDIVEAAMSGQIYMSGYAEDPPLRAGYSIMSYFGAAYATIGALLALRTRNSVGAQHVDISKQESISAHLEYQNFDYAFNDRISHRNGNISNLVHPCGMIYPASEGHVCIVTLGSPEEGPMGGQEFRMWPKLCKAINREDLLEVEAFNATEEDPFPGGVKRLRNAEEFDDVMREEFRTWDKKELYHVSQEAGVTNSYVSTPKDLLENPQLEARNFYRKVPVPSGGETTMPSMPYRFSDFDPQLERAPQLDEHGSGQRLQTSERNHSSSRSEPTSGTNSDLPLSDIRVLDFTTTWAGPMCTQIMADMGADVIKVESEDHFDISRTGPPFYEDRQGEPMKGEDRSGSFQCMNRNKRGLTVDLKSKEGQQLIKDMVSGGTIDVLVENYSAGTMEKMKLSYDELEALDESIIYCSLSGLGQEGPESHYRFYGPNIETHSGPTYLNGYPDKPPVRCGLPFNDPTSALHGLVAILSVLQDRDSESRGQMIDLSQLEVGALFTHQAITTLDLHDEVLNRIGNRDERGRIVQGVYRTNDEGLPEDEEGWIAIALRDETDWKAFGEVLGKPDWIGNDQFNTHQKRLDNQEELDEHIEKWTREMERYDAMNLLQAANVPAGVVQNMQDLYENDPHLRERKFWDPMTTPVMGTQLFPTVLPRLSDTPGELESYAPMIGQHTREIIYELTDRTGEDVEELEDKEII